MAHVIFYEKPDCAGNARQRALLEAAGHTLSRRDLLQTAWTPDGLLAFLGGLPVAQWFNRSAPRVKRGEVVPEEMDATAALALLVAEPLLIRRPLMRRDDGACLVGFLIEEVERFVGLGAAVPQRRSLEGCAADLTAGTGHAAQDGTGSCTRPVRP
jgi:nitrogenase-associated protein